MKNLLKNTNSKELEEEIIQNLDKLISENQNSFGISNELVNLADIFASKGDENVKKLVKKDILKPVKEVLLRFKGKGNQIETSSSHLMYKLCNEK